MARSNQATEVVAEAPVVQEQVQWVSHAELQSYASLAHKEKLTADEMFSLFEQDDKGYHVEGLRINAKVLAGMYHQTGRQSSIKDRIKALKAATDRQGGN